MLQVWIKVKFRIFGFDLGTVQKMYGAAYDGKQVTFVEQTPWVDPPKEAKVLLNERGVTLTINAVV
jgi:hypothetical protein